MLVYTIGYEGETIENWINRLLQAGITVLVDIREKPISRKKGFSKSALKNYLEKHNIEYTHYRSLGSPSDIRKQLMNDFNYDVFFEKYEKHLAAQDDLLKEIITTYENERPCFMCFEKNHRRCHRHSVAKRLEEIYPERVRVVHL
jgi:uncharacterized protein (DUF488 family)